MDAHVLGTTLPAATGREVKTGDVQRRPLATLATQDRKVAVTAANPDRPVLPRCIERRGEPLAGLGKGKLLHVIHSCKGTAAIVAAPSFDRLSASAFGSQQA